MTIGQFPRLVCPLCGKQVFGTQGRADHYRVKLEAQEGVPYRVYRCKLGWWHLTSRPRRWWAGDRPAA